MSGGWHDACDLRKWVVATVEGLMGLAAVAEVLKPDWDQGRIIEEMRWGNQYFLKMQEPAGYLMNYCGGDDGNRWTDNTVSADDRPIHTEPCEAAAQFRFIAAQCAVIRLTRKADAAYAATCQAAALRCLDWCVKGDRRTPAAHRPAGDRRVVGASVARRAVRLLHGGRGGLAGGDRHRMWTA